MFIDVVWWVLKVIAAVIVLPIGFTILAVFFIFISTILLHISDYILGQASKLYKKFQK